MRQCKSDCPRRCEGAGAWPCKYNEQAPHYAAASHPPSQPQVKPTGQACRTASMQRPTPSAQHRCSAPPAGASGWPWRTPQSGCALHAARRQAQGSVSAGEQWPTAHAMRRHRQEGTAAWQAPAGRSKTQAGVWQEETLPRGHWVLAGRRAGTGREDRCHRVNQYVTHPTAPRASQSICCRAAAGRRLRGGG